MDTIFGLATVRGRSGVAVIRISGQSVRDVLGNLAGKVPEPRRAVLRPIRWQDQHIDDGLVLFFPGPASFTGEDVAEIQVHGSPAIVRSLEDVLGRMPGLREAQPGEFTRRALMNGRLDLVQVEGLGDLLAAETEAQRRQAMRLYEGELGRRVASWRAQLVDAVALLEATIDFSDEEIPTDLISEVVTRVQGLRTELSQELAGVSASERVRDGFEVAIIGRPNVGKSTLLNALAQREAAITSEVAGTTRDVIEVRMDIGGLAVTLLDTAGMRDAEDPVERIGVERARARAEAAELRVFLLDEAGLPEGLVQRDGDICVWAKADLGSRPGGLAVSGRTGEGIAVLISEIEARLGLMAAGAGAIVLRRHQLAVELAKARLAEAEEKLRQDATQVDIAAGILREAVAAFDSLLGRVDVEAYLDIIFARFCIGK
jgi:tRNA modification GTPase